MLRLLEVALAETLTQRQTEGHEHPAQDVLVHPPELGDLPEGVAVLLADDLLDERERDALLLQRVLRVGLVHAERDERVEGLLVGPVRRRRGLGLVHATSSGVPTSVRRPDAPT